MATRCSKSYADKSCVSVTVKSVCRQMGQVCQVSSSLCLQSSAIKSMSPVKSRQVCVISQSRQVKYRQSSVVKSVSTVKVVKSVSSVKVVKSSVVRQVSSSLCHQSKPSLKFPVSKSDWVGYQCNQGPNASKVAPSSTRHSQRAPLQGHPTQGQETWKFPAQSDCW